MTSMPITPTLGEIETCVFGSSGWVLDGIIVKRGLLGYTKDKHMLGTGHDVIDGISYLYWLHYLYCAAYFYCAGYLQSDYDYQIYCYLRLIQVFSQVFSPRSL
jgi:hypothetical protein